MEDEILTDNICESIKDTLRKKSTPMGCYQDLQMCKMAIRVLLSERQALLDEREKCHTFITNMEFFLKGFKLVKKTVKRLLKSCEDDEAIIDLKKILSVSNKRIKEFNSNGVQQP